MKTLRSASFTLAIAALLASAAPFSFVRPEAVPVARLIGNLEKLLEKKPKDHVLHYKMARLNYLALVNQCSLVPTLRGRKGEVNPAPEHLARSFVWSLRWREAQKRALEKLGFDDKTKWTKENRKKLQEERTRIRKKLTEQAWLPKPPTQAELHRFAERAMRSFATAIELAPTEPLYRLGRASLAEQTLELERTDKLPKRAMIKTLAKWNDESTREEYYTAFRMSVDRDLARGSLPLAGLVDLVSHEAAQGYLRLIKTIESPTPKQKTRRAKVEEAIADLKKLRRRVITPILIGRSRHDRLDRMVDASARVRFDLDGDGVADTWPWPRRDVGILVWDPADSADVRSGRQLFGSVTWFLFHRDGFEALRLLDDNGDGVLRGLELEGLAVWTDRDGNGRSERAEVQPAWRCGITAIETQPATTRDVPSHPAGVRLETGDIRPTFDWIAERAQS